MDRRCDFLAADAPSADQKARDKAKDDVYAFDENYQQTRLWKVTVATGQETHVTSGDSSVVGYTVSRDGKKIAFHRAPDPLLGTRDRSEVWVMNADGSDEVEITHNAVGESDAVAVARRLAGAVRVGRRRSVRDLPQRPRCSWRPPAAVPRARSPATTRRSPSIRPRGPLTAGRSTCA